MRIGVPRETAPGERRVGLVPDSVGRLKKGGLEIRVQRGAGIAAFYPDEAYQAAGAELVDDAVSVLGDCDAVVKVQKPSLAECDAIRQGAILISLLPAATSAGELTKLSARSVTALALERVPRITRAQSMDILSSQATIAGYKAVLLGASQTAKLLPMLTTAAGSIPPAKAFVIGAGVAGLMAIATARRLGASVSGFDIRAAAREQVLSLGATFVGPEPAGDAEVAGGYARAQTEEEQRRTMEALANHIKDQDLVITTAQIPGKRAPILITSAVLATMKPGAVIVDLAAETGGNCEGTVPGEVRDHGGVTVIGPLNLPGTVPFHASLMFSKNVLTLLQHMIKDGVITLNLDDEIVGPMCVTHAGQARA
jgi:H+-translocating NAD(P) transhydrogenase subunit alpha